MERKKVRSERGPGSEAARISDGTVASAPIAVCAGDSTRATGLAVRASDGTMANEPGDTPTFLYPLI